MAKKIEFDIELQFTGQYIPTLGSTRQEVFIGTELDSIYLKIDPNKDFDFPFSAYKTKGTIKAYGDVIFLKRCNIFEAQMVSDVFEIQGNEEMILDWIQEFAYHNASKDLSGHIKITDKNSVIKVKFDHGSREPGYLKVWKIEAVEVSDLSVDNLFGSGFNTTGNIKPGTAICSVDLIFSGDTIPATGKVSKYKAYTGGFHYYEEDLDIHPDNDKFEHLFSYSKPDGFWSARKDKETSCLSGCYEVKNFVMSNQKEKVSQWLTNVVKYNPVLSGYIFIQDKIQSIKVEFNPQSNKYKIWKGQVIKTFDASGKNLSALIK